MSHRSIAFALLVVFFLSCGGDPAGVTSPINVTSPSSSTVWKHYQMNATIAWEGGSTDNVSIALFKGGNELVVLDSSAPNTGAFTLPGQVPSQALFVSSDKETTVASIMAVGSSSGISGDRIGVTLVSSAAHPLKRNIARAASIVTMAEDTFGISPP